jgi:hypothetical protein
LIPIKSEESIARIEALTQCNGLPEEEEIIIMPNGLVILDTKNPLSNVGTQVGDEVLCG